MDVSEINGNRQKLHAELNRVLREFSDATGCIPQVSIEWCQFFTVAQPARFMKDPNITITVVVP